MDQAYGYYAIPCSPSTSPKTAFSTASRRLEYKYMPMGCAGSPAAYTGMIKQAFDREIAEKIITVFMDDVIVGSTTFSEHLYKLERLFKALARNNLTLKPS